MSKENKKVILETKHYKDACDAIREKYGENFLMKSGEMAEKILQIKTEGERVDITINFYFENSLWEFKSIKKGNYVQKPNNPPKLISGVEISQWQTYGGTYITFPFIPQKNMDLYPVYPVPN